MKENEISSASFEIWNFNIPLIIDMNPEGACN